MVQVSCVQMSAEKFFKCYPSFRSFFPRSVLSELLSDSNYFVRFSPDSGKVEFGYLGDSWVLK